MMKQVFLNYLISHGWAQDKENPSTRFMFKGCYHIELNYTDGTFRTYADGHFLTKYSMMDTLDTDNTSVHYFIEND